MGCGGPSKHLPSTAKNVHDVTYGLNDFVRYMTAEITEQEYLEFKNRLNIKKSLHNSTYTVWSWDEKETVTWWTPSLDTTKTYGVVNTSEEYYTVIKYESGKVFYKHSKW